MKNKNILLSACLFLAFTGVSYAKGPKVKVGWKEKEAQAKVGARVHCVKELSADEHKVAVGDKGIITGIKAMDDKSFCHIITWDNEKGSTLLCPAKWDFIAFDKAK
jgi:hypothetical protein